MSNQNLNINDAVELLLEQANKYCEDGEHEIAIDYLDQALEIDKDSAKLWCEKGWNLFLLWHQVFPDSSLSETEASLKKQEIIACFDQAIAIEPDNFLAWYRRGQTQLEILSAVAESLVSLNQAIALQPDDFDSWWDKSFALYQLERYEEAVISYEKTLLIDPMHFGARDEFCRMLWEMERYEAALANYDKLLLVGENQADTLCRKCEVLEKLARYSEALDCCEKALQISPESHEALACKVRFLANLGQVEAALNCYERLIQIDPQSIVVAKVFIDIGYVADALRIFEQSIKNMTDKFWARVYQGDFLYELQDYQQAIASYHQALKSQPDDADTLYNLACCYALQKETKNALDNLEKAIKINPEELIVAAINEPDFAEILHSPQFALLVSQK
ncbi:tetratricopeptide repeat protein [Calothrix sp. UHCC 0171]|uniref:tetratricopeptide repeat protein n=1 Tax=Calothrix sp. UHCC 0171 TaxID=3110245 RepID=UPI002B220F3E|nr:tetratricopeptide repeat protein [Calothrix sp. UHCC 0171]MEA5571834.1 tetratricopeptide repeat protein [Calothrix sp. UHCC 0171]